MKPFPVTTHAVHRYLERVLGVNPSGMGRVEVEAVRLEIALEVAIAADHPGVAAIRKGSWLYPIRDGAVVTVHRACRPDLRTGRQRGERRDDEDEI